MTGLSKKAKYTYLNCNALFFLLVCFFPLFVVAQHHEPSDSILVDIADTLKNVKGKNKVVEFITKRRNFLIAPQLDRAPETGILTGLYYLQLYKNKKDSATRTSNTETFASITQKSQYLAEFNETILFHKEKYIQQQTLITIFMNEGKKVSDKK